MKELLRFDFKQTLSVMQTDILLDFNIFRFLFEGHVKFQNPFAFLSALRIVYPDMVYTLPVVRAHVREEIS